MYAAKQAIIAKEHDAEVESTIFYMDLRAFGKDFDKYIDLAKNKHGVSYRRAMIAGIEEDPETKNLLIHHVDEAGNRIKEEYDLAILSIGFQPSEQSRTYGELFGIDLDDYGFAATSRLTPVKTSRDGIYVAGIYQGPKDIPETVTQGSGAAAQVMSLLGDRRGSEVEEVVLPPEIDIAGQDPRIGVFVCHCGVNIAGTVDVQQVAEEVGREQDVVHAETIMYACAPDGQDKVKELIKEKGINRVVIASCTPRTHSPLFMDTIREVGLNKFLFELADIREQCSWVHKDNKEFATAKATEITKMNVAKARHLDPVSQNSVGVNHAAMVVGGGLAGMTAALSLAEQGYGVHLVERQEQLGGLMRMVRRNLEGDDLQSSLADTIAKVEAEPAISVYLGATVEKTDGYVGNFVTT